MRLNKSLLIILLISFTGILTSCSNGSSESEELISSDLVNNPNTADSDKHKNNLPEITFNETEHNFGKIIEGETVAYTFSFTNTGKGDLIIADVSTSCGCTVASFTEEAIRPGKEGTIKISFNSRGRKGFQNKAAIVVANTQPNATQLRIKAEVVAPGD